jgi:predicted DNA-binding transcriptional regulator YafY
MPQNKHAFIRYKAIDERLRSKQKPAPTLNDFIELCSEKLGKKISRSTIEKDLDAMRTDEALGFRAPIKYDAYKRGYVYEDENYSIEKNPLTEDETFSIELAVQILQQFKELPVMKNLQKPLQKMMTSLSIEANENSFIQLDKPTKYIGDEWLQPIAKAIQNKNVIKIKYQAFQNNYSTEHILEPVLLKEYENRWYLMAYSSNKNPALLLTFGLDRIVDLQKTAETFSPKKFNAELHFKNHFGITSLEAPVEKVQLQFKNSETKYIQTAPWHKSQKLIKQTKNFAVFELQIVISHELKMKILSRGSGVTVLKPTYLKEIIKNEINELQKNYL